MKETEVSLLVSPALTDVAGPRMSIEPVEGMALLRVDMPRFYGPTRVVKRTIDVVGSLLGLIVLAIPVAIGSMDAASVPIPSTPAEPLRVHAAG